MYAFNSHDHFTIRNRDDAHRFMSCVLGGRDSLSDLIITEKDSPELAALKRERQQSIVSNMCRHLGD